MNRKKMIFALSFLLIAGFILFAACGSAEKGDKDNEGTVNSNMKEYKTTLYFANNEYVQTGNEEFSPMLEVKDFILKCKEGTQYFNVINTALRTVPENLKAADTFIDDKIVVTDVSVKDGTAFVDLAGGQMNSGSLTESFVISQIVETLLGSFDEIERVQFLVDGEASESLMGHFDVTQPYTEGIYSIR